MPQGGSHKLQRDPASPVRTPIILAKNEKHGGGDSRSPSSASRLWKPDNEVKHTTSSKHGIPSSLQSGELPSSHPSYKIQQRNDLRSAHGNDWTKRTEQPEAIQLVDAQMNWLSEHLMEFLLEQNEYRVVGVLGSQGVGKTYIMSLLANHSSTKKSPFASKEKSSEYFGHATAGLSAYVTNERTILLDCQPLFSSSVLDDIILNERKFRTDSMNCEDVNDFINLKLVMFVMAVCHVVLVVENCFTDPNVHRLLQAVEMLKPPQLSSEKQDDHSDFSCKIVFVENMVNACDPDKACVSHMQSTLTKIYEKSSLNLNRTQSGQVNVLLLTQEMADDYYASEIRKKYQQTLIHEVMSLQVQPILNHTQLSEKNWLLYAGKMWEAVKKCPFLSEYMRLLG